MSEQDECSTKADDESLSSSSSSSVILLYTSMPANSVVGGNQRFVRQAFLGRNIKLQEIDGMCPESKETRDELFGVSNLRGKYPQVFVKVRGETTFVGDFEKINELNDCETLPPEILQAHPHIETFSKVFERFLPPPPP